MTTTETGILVYGYDKDEALLIQEILSACLDESILLKSATDLGNKTVKTILENKKEFFYKDSHPKILMFFGMDDQKIQRCLTFFPDDLARPIFCGLTKHNITWKFEGLVEHLLEEQEMMKQQIAQRQNQNST